MERRGEESGSAASYMQIVFIVYDDFFARSDLSLSFISFHRDGGGNSIRDEEEGESLAVMIGSERESDGVVRVPFFGTKERSSSSSQLFPPTTTTTTAENNL